MIDVSEESDAFLVGVVLGDKKLPEYYWSNGKHDIPLFWIGKKKYYVDKRREMIEYYLKISYRGRARARKKYVEWPLIAYVSPNYVNRWGILIEHHSPTNWEYIGYENNEPKYELRGTNPYEEYIILESENGRAKYMKAFPMDSSRQLLWKLVGYEGTVK